MDDISTSTLLIALVVLIILSAFFSSSETAMMSLNRYRLRHLTKEGHKSAQRASDLLDRPDRLIGLILIGNNLVNNAAATVASILALHLLGDLGVALAPVVLTLVMLLFAEVTPKTMAALYPEKIAFPASIVLKVLLTAFYPVVWFVNAISNGLLALLRIKPSDGSGDALSSEELRTVVAEAGAMIPRRHKDMLVSILDLEKVQVEDVMTPRADIRGIDINDDWNSIVKQLTHAQHTRLLLYRDNIDDAVGFVHARDALRLLSKNQFTKSALLRAVREIYFIPEGTPLNVQLLKFQRNKERIGLVVDEYGDIQGLVTLEDILEEIVGDFTTDMAPAPHEEIVPQPDGSYLVEGSISLRELNKEMGWDFPTDGPKTLNGLILEHLEEIPEANISIRLAGYPLEIMDVKDNMVKTARIQPQLKRD
ncbi:HlyC/CorC family transporter [Gallaecimonas xiamenensis]|uniref:Magnesium and cobalt efflux protein CorC n=1 Tax=Gallaecimonas xiamenensis 3-C-1 TaxID=745411 RepID=K2JA60_9GAMM|nr:HlyC/CorC family transporter [Gallaecimonas xiamenensis]EKE71687.1 transporter [Gallaecimonas xiamenensis 3-C-1]